MDRFCKFCGAEHTSHAYPKTCISCENITWINPTPVAVILQPIINDDGKLGVLIGKRRIEPFSGGWNLIGGYIDTTDQDVIHAAVRELEEETGFIANPITVNLFWSYSDGRYLLVFCENNDVPINVSELARFVPNEECSEIAVAWGPQELCFHSHTNALKKWFARFERAGGYMVVCAL